MLDLYELNSGSIDCNVTLLDVEILEEKFFLFKKDDLFINNLFRLKLFLTIFLILYNEKEYPFYFFQKMLFKYFIIFFIDAFKYLFKFDNNFLFFFLVN